MTRQAQASAAREDALDGFLTVSRALVGIVVRSISAAPIEVTLAQHRLLVLLAAGGEQSVKALAEQLGINASNASRLCDRLQKLDMVARDRSPSDGREVVVSLTAEGRALVSTIRSRRRHDVQRILRQMSGSDVEVTVAALTAFSNAAHEIGEAQWTPYAL